MRTLEEIRRDRTPLFDITGGMSTKFEHYAVDIREQFALINTNLVAIRELLEQIEKNTRATKIEVR